MPLINSVDVCYHTLRMIYSWSAPQGLPPVTAVKTKLHTFYIDNMATVVPVSNGSTTGVSAQNILPIIIFLK
jgi:hypothetical protein